MSPEPEHYRYIPPAVAEAEVGAATDPFAPALLDDRKALKRSEHDLAHIKVRKTCSKRAQNNCNCELKRHDVTVAIASPQKVAGDTDNAVASRSAAVPCITSTKSIAAALPPGSVAPPLPTPRLSERFETPSAKKERKIRQDLESIEDGNNLRISRLGKSYTV